MGNFLGKRCSKKGEPGHNDRKKVYEAQDSFVRKLMDTTDGATAPGEGDTDSVGPDERRETDAFLELGDKNDPELFPEETGTDWDPNEVFPLLPNTEVERRRGYKRIATVVSQAYDEMDCKVQKIHDLTKYEFNFENLIFEGGGNKGLAYCGAIQILEELGIWPNIRRFAGTSAGAMTAALLSVGYDSGEIEDFLSQDLSRIFLDHSCGYFSLLPNLLKGYGWNPGKRIYQWFGDALEAKTGTPDITFNEIYERFGKELCVVVTNLNMMNAEYFHPKTTPDVPVRLAVRMSMAIPGLFQASKYEQHGQVNTYIDGGVLCNYPISCYDGWWLSMKMEDSFLNRLQPLENFPRLFEKKERFGTYNDKTIGFLLYADNERDILRDILQQRVGTDLLPFPDTKLAKEKMRKKKLQEKVKLEHIRNLHAVSAFLKVLKKHNADSDDKINKTELRNALNDRDDFPERYVERLFGKNVTVDEAMAALDEDGNGEVYYHEIVHFIERTGVSLQARFLGYQRKEIRGLFSFFDTLQSALLTNVKRIFVEERDIDRTVGINTGHVGTSDFKLEPKDREFVIQQGRRSTEAFLKYYLVQTNAQTRDQLNSASSQNSATTPPQPGSESGETSSQPARNGNITHVTTSEVHQVPTSHTANNGNANIETHANIETYDNVTTETRVGTKDSMEGANSGEHVVSVEVTAECVQELDDIVKSLQDTIDAEDEEMTGGDMIEMSGDMSTVGLLEKRTDSEKT